MRSRVDAVWKLLESVEAFVKRPDPFSSKRFREGGRAGIKPHVVWLMPGTPAPMAPRMSWQARRIIAIAPTLSSRHPLFCCLVIFARQKVRPSLVFRISRFSGFLSDLVCAFGLLGVSFALDPSRDFEKHPPTHHQGTSVPISLHLILVPRARPVDPQHRQMNV